MPSEADTALADIFAAANIEPPEVPEREHIDHEEISVTPFDAVSLIPTEGTGYEEPWAQYGDESSEGYERFLWFRDQGAGRSAAETAKHFGLSKQAMNSGRFEWTLRARAWDAHMDRVYRLKLQEAIQEMAERHASQMVEALEHISLPFKALAAKMEGDPDFLDKLSKTSVVKLFDMAVKASKVAPTLMTAERLSRGMPTEIVQAEGEVRHVHEISAPEQLAEVLAILDRNHALTAGGGAGGFGEIIEAEVVEVHDDDADPEADSIPTA